jgi:DNA-binding transcriptional ArsR family regulator
MVERISDGELTLILKAASDPTRRAILTILVQHGPTRVTDLSTHFDMSLNSVSKHIKVLEGAGLVERKTEWREHLIAARLDPINAIDHWFTKLRSVWEMRLEALEAVLTEDDEND